MRIPGPPADNMIRILTFDPGTDTFGCAILDVDVDTYEPLVVYGGTITATKEVKRFAAMAEMRYPRDARLEVIRGHLADLIREVAPTLVATESPFLQRGKVSAFESLVECQKMIREVLWDYSTTMHLRRIDPVSVKNYIGVSHKGTDKDDIRRAVHAVYKDKCAEGVDMTAFDEHTNDALAVANVIYRNFLLGEVVESSRKKKSRRRKNAK